MRKRSGRPAKTTAAPAPEPDPVPEDDLFWVSSKEVDAMTERANAWLSAPDKLQGFVAIQALVHLQLLDRLALKPPVGRSGQDIAARANKSFLEMSAGVMKAITSKRLPDPGQGILPSSALDVHPLPEVDLPGEDAGNGEGEARTGGDKSEEAASRPLSPSRVLRRPPAPRGKVSRHAPTPAAKPGKTAGRSHRRK